MKFCFQSVNSVSLDYLSFTVKEMSAKIGSRKVQTTGEIIDFVFGDVEPGDWKKDIREGADYQVEVPEFIGQPCMQESGSDDDRETLLWSPSSQANLSNRQMNSYLDVAQFGAETTLDCRTEHALHVLHESGGDIRKAMSTLTSDTRPQLPEGHPMRNYTYSECGLWSDEENERFFKSLRLHGKNFLEAANNVETKTVKQVTQYYYVWKKQFHRKYHIVRPSKVDLVMQPAGKEKHNTRGSAKRAVAAAVKQASNQAVVSRLREADDSLDDSLSQPLDNSGPKPLSADISQPLDDSGPKPLSADRVEVEMYGGDSSDGSVITEGADTVQQAICQNVLNIAISSGCSTTKEQSPMTPPLTPTTPPLTPTIPPLTPTIPPLTPITLFLCSFEHCRKGFTSKKSLQCHLSCHKKAAKSSPSTPGLKNISNHRGTPIPATDQSGEAVFPCCQCDRVFAKVKSRNAHMKCHKTPQTTAVWSENLLL